MGAMVAAGNSTLSSADLTQENGTRIKRKFKPTDAKNPDQSDVTIPSYELFPEEKLRANLDLDQHPGECDVGKPCTRLSVKELGSDKLCDANWSEVMEPPLEELALFSLHTIYKSAIKTIASCGYTEEVATEAVLRSGHCNGCKDAASNIADNALVFLNSGHDVNSLLRENLTEALKELEKKVLENMVAMLKEARPSFSTGDALWCLLICDMNLPDACAIDDNLCLGDGDTPSGAEPNSTTLTPPTASEFHVPGREKQTNVLQCPRSQPMIPTTSEFSDLYSRVVAASENHVSGPEKPAGCSQCPSFLPMLPNSDEFADLYSRVVAVYNHVNGEDPNSNPGQKYPASFKDYILMESGSGGVLRSSMSKEKPVRNRKGLAGWCNREYILQQRTIHVEKNYQGKGSKPFLTTVHKLSDFMPEKKFKLISKSSTVNLMNFAHQSSKTVRMDTAGGDVTSISSSVARTSPSSSSYIRSSSSSPIDPVNTSEPLSSLPSKSTITAGSKSGSIGVLSSKYSDCANIQFDKIWGQLIPEAKKDEMLLKLKSHVSKQQDQLNGWAEWAQKKVMQAAHRLSKDKAELDSLRREKDEVDLRYKEKQALEENTVKRLAEMEKALSYASSQVVKANDSVRKLGIENAILRQQMQVAMALAEKSAATCEEVSLKEMATIKKLQSVEREKAVLQGDHATEKRKHLDLKHQHEQANGYHGQIEARRRQEEKVKEEALAQAEMVRKLRAQTAVSAKVKNDAISVKAESGLQRYLDDIQRLRHEVAELKLMEDSLKIAALKRGIFSNAQLSSQKGDQDNSGSLDLQRDRECVMCLTEERSVVFLPCAHQVVCANCNRIHARQGLQDCPSCRTSIRQRIHVKSANS